MPVTLFLVRDWVDRAAAASLHVQNPKIQFGSHTCSHPRLPSLSAEEAYRQLRDSRSSLACRLGEANAFALAYPKGAYTSSVAGQARALGYECTLTTDESLNDLNADPFTLKRVVIGDDDDVPAFAARVCGLTSWLKGIFQDGGP